MSSVQPFNIDVPKQPPDRLIEPSVSPGIRLSYSNGGPESESFYSDVSELFSEGSERSCEDINGHSMASDAHCEDSTESLATADVLHEDSMWSSPSAGWPDEDITEFSAAIALPNEYYPGCPDSDIVQWEDTSRSSGDLSGSSEDITSP